MISAYLISKWIVYIEGGSAASKDLFIRVRKKNIMLLVISLFALKKPQ